QYPVNATYALTSANAVLPPVSIGQAQGRFYTHNVASGTFDATPASTALFTESFPLINFNPLTTTQQSYCTNTTGVNEESRPGLPVRSARVAPRINGGTGVAHHPRRPTSQA